MKKSFLIIIGVIVLTLILFVVANNYYVKDVRLSEEEIKIETTDNNEVVIEETSTSTTESNLGDNAKEIPVEDSGDIGTGTTDGGTTTGGSDDGTDGITDGGSDDAKNVDTVGCPQGTTSWGDFCCVNGKEEPVRIGWPLKKKVCQPIKEGCLSPRVFCEATRNACCLEGSGCAIGSIWGVDIATCIPPNNGDCNPDSPYYCGITKVSKDYICCRGNTRCEKPRDNPVCVPTECSFGESICSGNDPEGKGLQICCPYGNCYNYRNGGPFCAPSQEEPSSNPKGD